MGSVDALSGLLGFGQTSRRLTTRGTAKLATIWHRFGETNRYSKDHKTPISVDSISVEIPSSVRQAQFEDYKHAPVSSENKEIRVLELLPAKWSKARDFVACRLMSKSLVSDNDLTYETLSYCWGKSAREIPVFTVPSEVPDHGKISEALTVTPQLFAALRRLRLEESSRFLWIDQLCIDQTNIQEKGEQVLLMGEIYARSSRTIIWLGEEDSSRESLEALLQSSSRTSLSSQVQSASLPIEIKAEDVQHIEGLTSLLNRDWFTRAWIFQEAVLGNDLTVYCGGLQMSFESLRRIVEAVKDYQYAKGGYARSIMQSTVGCDTIELIQHGREAGNCSDPMCIVFKEPDLLQTLFEALRNFQATNDRDLIYAFLSQKFQKLSTQNRILPDYTKPIEWVWTDAASRMIRNSNSLEILAAARGESMAKYPNLPSWVPDWSDCFRFARPIQAPDLTSAFNASCGRAHKSIEKETSFRLQVRGKIIRTVFWISSCNFEMTYYRDGIKAFLQLDEHMQELRQHFGLQRRMTSEQVHQRWNDLRGSILRTLLADGAFSHRQPLDVGTRELERIILSETEILEKKRIFDSNPDVHGGRDVYEVLEKLWGWGLIAQKKVLFTTADVDNSRDAIDGINFGLAATAIEPGDKIAILHGSKVPIVLRQSELGWKVISQCYLDGWMYGDENNVFWAEDEADTFNLI